MGVPIFMMLLVKAMDLCIRVITPLLEEAYCMCGRVRHVIASILLLNIILGEGNCRSMYVVDLSFGNFVSCMRMIDMGVVEVGK